MFSFLFFLCVYSLRVLCWDKSVRHNQPRGLSFFFAFFRSCWLVFFLLFCCIHQETAYKPPQQLPIPYKTFSPVEMNDQALSLLLVFFPSFLLLPSLHNTYIYKTISTQFAVCLYHVSTRGKEKKKSFESSLSLVLLLLLLLLLYQRPAATWTAAALLLLLLVR